MPKLKRNPAIYSGDVVYFENETYYVVEVHKKKKLIDLIAPKDFSAGAYHKVIRIPIKTVSLKRRIIGPNYKKHPVRLNPSITAQTKDWWNRLSQQKITNLAASLGLRLYLTKANWKYLTRQDKKKIKNYFLVQMFPYYSHNPCGGYKRNPVALGKVQMKTWQHQRTGMLQTLFRGLRGHDWFDRGGTYVATTKELHRFGWKAIG